MTPDQWTAAGELPDEIALWPASPLFILRERVALMLRDDRPFHPDTDPNDAAILHSATERVRQMWRETPETP